MKLSPVLLLNLILLISSCTTTDRETTTVIRDPLERKTDSLLQLMSLEEKIGQMMQINITEILPDSISENYSDAGRIEPDTAKMAEFIKNYHVGSFLNGRGFPAEDWLEFMTALQEINMEESRLKIPVLYGIDHVHGSSYLKEGTIFPHNINMAATFDTSFAAEMGRITVRETAGLGHRWIFAPVMDVGRNKYWGRYYETWGEDPYLASQMGTAFIKGIQANGNVAACAKHFIGYSDPKSGWDRSPAEIPDQVLYEYFLPPFKAAINSGVKTIMINSGEVNGTPVHASKELLTDLLRDTLGFEGLAVSDWLDIIALEKMHHVAHNEKEATAMAINAGVDMSMTPVTTDFFRYVRELVQEGKIPESRIDEAVGRILKVKFSLGLFEDPYPASTVPESMGAEAHKAKSLQAARESIVLIKNEEDLLPLKQDLNILLTGPNADRKIPLTGGWTYRFAPQREKWFPADMPTVKDALSQTFPNTEFVQNPGNGKPDADVALYIGGEETAYAETAGSINDLTLAKTQLEEIKRLKETGIPVILILLEGRPRIIHEVIDEADAVIFAGLPGIYGATAIADIISGKANPSGKMSFTYPYKQGHIIPYNHKHSEYSELRPVKGELLRYSIADFGEGLSYTSYEYSNLTLSDTVITPERPLKASVNITNTGERAGKEAVLWFISDEVATITRPVKSLLYFEKQLILPGETKTFELIIKPEQHLSFPNSRMQKILEEGYFTLSVGNEKERFRLRK